MPAYLQAAPILIISLLDFNKMGYPDFKKCIDACLACAVASNHCAYECLHSSEVTQRIRCIQLDHECAIICFAAANMLSSGNKWIGALYQECAEICDACAEECEKHAHMDHCKKCAEMCRKCAEECRSIIKMANTA